MVLGQFTPSSKTEGEIRLDGRLLNYRFFAFTHGYNFSVYQNGLEVAVRQCDSHEGQDEFRLGGKTYELDGRVRKLYSERSCVCRFAFTEQEVTIEFDDEVPDSDIGMLAVFVSLDVMWANLVGFTRTRAHQRN